jgi:YggT family protein
MAFVFSLLQQLIQVYSWALIIYILMSWFPNARSSSIGQILAKICEPYLEQFRKIIPPLGMIDISPIVAFFVLNLATMGLGTLQRWLVGIL